MAAETAEPQLTATTAPAHDWRGEWSALATLLLTKVLILALGAVSYQILAEERLTSLWAALAIWDRWDAPHYLDLARYGYAASGERGLFIVFYPLFPWLTRLVGRPLGDYLVGAFIVSTIASLIAVLLLYRLVRLDHDEKVARRAVWFFCIFPASYFLHIGYTESLFIALTLGTFLAARAGRWPLVGLLGALACLARVNGLVLAPALAVEVLVRYRQTRRWEWGWAWIGAVPLGFGGYLLLNYRVTGDPFAFLSVTRDHWFKSFAPPWSGIADMLRSLSWRPLVDQITVVWQQAFFIVLVGAGAVVAWLRLRPSYAVWMTLNLLLFTSTSFILSVPRYSLTLFPLFILFAQLGRRPAWFQALTAWSLLLLALLATLFVLQRGMAY
jgi:hypothetical protein